MIEITIYDNGSINPAPQEIVETADDLAAIRAFERYLSKAKMQWNVIDISVYSPSGEKKTKKLLRQGGKDAMEMAVKQKAINAKKEKAKKLEKGKKGKE